jgi:hypothetical protein
MLPRTIKATLLLLAICPFFVSPTRSQDTEKPPPNIIEHYHWCSKPKSHAAALARFEGFWSLYAPTGEHEYEDAIHVRFVHLCAYRLAELYAETGDVKKCRYILEWLEKEDNFIK